MKKILKYSFIGLAALCTALLCGGYHMLGHALNPDELITRSRNSQASYEYMFGQYPELKIIRMENFRRTPQTNMMIKAD